MIEATNIIKSFGRRTVLTGINLTCGSEEILTLFGNNGSGKSTMLNILSGILLPDTGFVHFDGNNIFKGYNRHKSQSGYMLEKPFYIDKLSAKEYLLFMGSLFSIPQDYLTDRIGYLLDHFQVPADNQFIEHYSQGTKKKVSFISSILNEPKYLILDEPFSGMDMTSVQKCFDILVKMKQGESHIILSSNQFELVSGITDTFIAIQNGKTIPFEDFKGT